MSELKNKTILITGGASGIGKIMSRLSLARKAKVIIWDINTENIARTLKELSPLGNISADVVDVSKLEAIEEAAQKLIKEHGNIDILINNAGIVVGRYFHEHSAIEIEQVEMVRPRAKVAIMALINGDVHHRGPVYVRH